MTSALRHYDAAVLDYLDFIEVGNGKDTFKPQIQLAIPSRSGVKVNIDENNQTPLLPLLVVSRRSLSPVTESKIMYSRLTRPYKIWRNVNSRKYEGIEFMAYVANYQVNIITDNMETYNSIVEQLLFKLMYKRYVRVKIDVKGQNFSTNAPITDVSVSDNISYDSIPDSETRLLMGTFTFNLHITFYNTKFGINEVDRIGDIETKVDEEIPSDDDNTE